MGSPSIILLPYASLVSMDRLELMHHKFIRRVFDNMLSCRWFITIRRQEDRCQAEVVCGETSA
jgi:hypothetical protein